MISNGTLSVDDVMEALTTRDGDDGPGEGLRRERQPGPGSSSNQVVRRLLPLQVELIARGGGRCPLETRREWLEPGQWG